MEGRPIVWLLFTSLVVSCISVMSTTATEQELSLNSRTNSKLRSLWEDKQNERVVHLEKREVIKQVEAIRAKRQSGSGPPVIHGDFPFTDAVGHTYAQIHYSGDNSPVIIVLTYSLQNSFTVSDSNLYRSDNYGVSFVRIHLESTGPTLWYNFQVGSDKNLIVFSHASQPKVYYSRNEGVTWSTNEFNVSSIDPRTLVWNSRHDEWALAHDITNDRLYLSQNFGANWIKLSDNVDLPIDYQWANPKYYEDTTVFYNTYDPNDSQRGNYTVGLYSQVSPYNNSKEVDPNLGRHDDFLMVGPYIFAQKTVNSVVGLYISFKRASFQKAMIPSNDPHQGYYVAHIDELQALVIIEHDTGQNNLYLSDEEGVYFSLSLPDLVVENTGIDLEVIRGVNGTLVANQYVRTGPSQPTDTRRTLISLDNGGNWELVVPPDTDSVGSAINCDPPQCSLHLHMDSSAYNRLGVYSRDNAPGLIIAHGTTGSQLAEDPDLYLSHDGGVTWVQTLQGSWGVTVADHGGLMVAVRDHHYRNASTELKYTCDEGQSWSGFSYTQEAMTIYGVITEPGEYTTTVSLYGLKASSSTWDVVTVNFSSIFTRSCTSRDFYRWHPWDEREGSDCILGADVSIERRQSDVCCLIGTEYERDVQVSTCDCTSEDYDCDYGFMHTDGIIGPCVHDPAIQLDDPCLTSEVISYNKSTGYRKIPGDICVNGVESVLEPQPFLCCESPPRIPTDKPMTTVAQPITTKTGLPTTQKPTTKPAAVTTQAQTTAKPTTQAPDTKPVTNRAPTTTRPGTSGQGTSQGPTAGAVSVLDRHYNVVIAALGALFGLAVLVAIILGILAAVFASKHSKARRQFLRLATSGDGMGRGGVSFVKADSDTQVLLHSGTIDTESDESDQDEQPLKP